MRGDNGFDQDGSNRGDEENDDFQVYSEDRSVKDDRLCRQTGCRIKVKNRSQKLHQRVWPEQLERWSQDLPRWGRLKKEEA